MNTNKKELKTIITGVLASIVLLSLYGITMTLLSGWGAAVEQFLSLWWLMIPLSIAFGIQIGLYTRLKEVMKQKTNGAIAVSGSSAGVGMLACCAHHATDVLPILGLSAVSLFLSRYQIPILLISLGINVGGIAFMYKQLKRVSL